MLPSFLDKSLIDQGFVTSLLPFIGIFVGIFLSVIAGGMKWKNGLNKFIIIAAHLFYIFFQLSNVFNSNEVITSNYFQLCSVVISLLCILSVIFAGEYFRKNLAPEWSVFFLISSLGAVVMPMCNNFISLFVAIETFSIPAYFLASLDSNRIKSLEAGIKYLLFGALTSSFYLLGIILLFGLYGSFDYSALATLITSSDIVSISVFFLIFSALLFKISGFPFHLWSPDVYQGSPSSSTAWLASSAKVAGVSSILAIFYYSKLSALDNSFVPDMFVCLGLGSILIGHISAFSQQSVKRLLAFSGVANVGYLLLALPHYNETASSILVYLFQYGISFVALMAFIEFYTKKLNLKTELTIDDLPSLKDSNCKSTVILFSILLLSVAGLPPLLGFFAKYSLIADLWKAGSVTSVVLVAVGSLLGMVYYLNLIKKIWLEGSSQKNIIENNSGISYPYISAVLGSIILFVSLLSFSAIYKLLIKSESFFN